MAFVRGSKKNREDYSLLSDGEKKTSISFGPVTLFRRPSFGKKKSGTDVDEDRDTITASTPTAVSPTLDSTKLSSSAPATLYTPTTNNIRVIKPSANTTRQITESDDSFKPRP